MLNDFRTHIPDISIAYTQCLFPSLSLFFSVFSYVQVLMDCIQVRSMQICSNESMCSTYMVACYVSQWKKKKKATKACNTRTEEKKINKINEQIEQMQSLFGYYSPIRTKLSMQYWMTLNDVNVRHGICLNENLILFFFLLLLWFETRCY